LLVRVVGGSARGLRLQGPPTEGTRPISDRAKEALFNILGPGIRGTRFLDLFAGTGAVGIEALSRGAAEAVLVERDRAVVDVIRANLTKTRLTDGAQAVQADVFAWLERSPDPFDLVFSGPPQWQELWGRSLAAIDERPGLLAPDATVIVQLDPREEADEPPLTRLQLDDSRRYGNVALRFYSVA
jgi:16S rRNA (guanine(966)-N(2))-methyltransferase RsmD